MEVVRSLGLALDEAGYVQVDAASGQTSLALRVTVRCFVLEFKPYSSQSHP